MKKIVLVLGIVLLLSGCSVKLDSNYEVDVKKIDKCTNEAIEYYDNGKQKVYLVCLSKVTLKDSKHKVELKKYLKQDNIDLNDVSNELIIKLVGETSLLDESAIFYRDGGTMKFTKNGYTIVKCNTEEGNKDIYIGTDELDINKGFENGFCGH